MGAVLCKSGAHPHTHQHKGGGCGGGAGFQIWDLELGENVGEEQLLSSYGKMDGMRAVK